MNLTIGFLGVVAALMVWMLPALVSPQHFRYHLRRSFGGAWGARDIFRGFLSEEHGVTITYTSQFTNFGTSTAPTAAQASGLPTQTAQVNFTDGDTQAVIVHNWGLPGSSPGFLFPEISYYCAQQDATPSSFATAFTFGISNTNSITMNKTSIGTGSGGTWNVIMRRPHSVGL